MGVKPPAWFQQLQRPGVSGELEIQHLSLSNFKRLIVEALVLTRDSAFGLLVGDRLTFNSHGLLGYVSSQSVTPREALTLIARYFPLRTSLLMVQLDINSRHARLRFTENLPLGDISQPVLEAVVLTIKNLFEYVTLGLSRVDTVSFAFAQPAHQQLAHALFGCEVQYQANWTGLTVPLAGLDRSVRTSNPKILIPAITRCQAELARLARQRDLQSQVRMLIQEKRNELPSLTMTAQLLNLTPRTLHRRLIEEGTSYREILESVREQMATHLLQDQQLSIQEVAYMLGYGDIANFRRAFKRWTGEAPSRFRQALA